MENGISLVAIWNLLTQGFNTDAIAWFQKPKDIQ